MGTGLSRSTRMASFGLPIWQRASDGTWFPGALPGDLGMQLPVGSQAALPIQDLSVGQATGANVLQIVYLGADGNVYINFQNADGWGWWGPLVPD